MNQHQLEDATARAEQALGRVRQARDALGAKLARLQQLRGALDEQGVIPPNGEMERALLRALEAMRRIEQARDRLAQNAPPPAPAVAPPAPSNGQADELARTRQQLDETRQQLEQLARRQQQQPQQQAELPGPEDPALARRRLVALEQTREMLEGELRDEQQRSQRITQRTRSLELLLEQQRTEMDRLSAERADWEQLAPSRDEDRELIDRLRQEIDTLKQHRPGSAEEQRLRLLLEETLEGRHKLEQALSSSKETLMRVLRAKIDLEVNFRTVRDKLRQMQAEQQDLDALRADRGRGEQQVAALKGWLETTIQRRDALSRELERARQEVDERLSSFGRTTSELEALRGTLEQERQEKHETIQKLIVLEQRLEQKYPMAGRKILQTFRPGGEDVSEALATHFDYLFNFRHGYPFIDFNNLRSLTRKFIAALRADPGSALDLRYYSTNGYLKEHSFNVARLAIYLGMHKGYRDSALELLGLCGLLQDIGMLTVPESVFKKSARLEKEEIVRIREHPTKSVDLFAEMAAEGDIVGDLLSTVLQEHHEREDGSGYPHGKQGAELHDFSKVLLIADTYAAMTAPRVYRGAALPHEVMRRLIAGAQQGSYNRDLVQTFVRAMSLYPVGSFVELSSGETAKVVAADPEAPKSPVVKLVKDTRGEPLFRPVYVSLSQEKGLAVARAVRGE